MSIAGRLELNPKIHSVTKLAGDDKSFFVSCIPFSSIGAVGDSRIRAKNLEWKKKQKPPIGNNWVVMGSEQYSRYRTIGKNTSLFLCYTQLLVNSFDYLTLKFYLRTFFYEIKYYLSEVGGFA